jgi:hypothetical protein
MPAGAGIVKTAEIGKRTADRNPPFIAPGNDHAQ